MGSAGKKKTTMAKLMRESRLRERRVEKQARKVARRYSLDHPEPEVDEASHEDEAIDEPVTAEETGGVQP